MLNRNLRLRVFLGLALVLVAVLVWRLATRGDDSLAGLDPDAARIERLRRKGDVDALAREAANPRLEVALRALDALGYAGPKSVPHIERAMQDARVEVREKAAIALGRAARRDQTASLAEAAAHDPSANVRAAAATALGQVYAYNQMQTLLDALEDENRMVRRRAAVAIIRITGIDFRFQADGPPDQRRETVAKIRALWPKMGPDVRDYYASPRSEPER